MALKAIFIRKIDGDGVGTTDTIKRGVRKMYSPLKLFF